MNENERLASFDHTGTTRYYKLIDWQVVLCKDIIEQAMWATQTPDYEKVITVGNDMVLGTHISTRFLGVATWGNHIIFETAVIRKDGEIIHFRTDTWAEAEEMHRQLVSLETTAANAAN